MKSIPPAVFLFLHVSSQVVVLYNGEIYNFRSLWPDSASDGEALLPLYLRQGHLFPRACAGRSGGLVKNPTRR